MTAVDVLLQLEAAHDGEARLRVAKRHRQLEPEPLVVVAYRLAGEAAAPLGLLYGTSPATARLLVAPEPRNREIRFREVFNPFAADLCRYVEGRSAHTIVERGRDLVAAAPQVVVPNNATAQFVALLGRSLRYLRTEGEFAVPTETVRAGAHLTWLGTRAEHPGSSVVLAATDLLRRHWATGISDLESEDLFVQLAWIDPSGARGVDAARAVEQQRITGEVLSAGPTPDPAWDRDVLEPLINQFNEARQGAQDARVIARLGVGIVEAVEAALRPAWDATWRAVHLVESLPVAASVVDRWRDDRYDFGRHSQRVDTGEARFRTRDSVKQSAWMISQRERAAAALAASEALDDPMVMAGVIADGQAITGTVIDVNPPMVTVALAEPCSFPEGVELYWTELPSRCSVEMRRVTGYDQRTVELETKKGKTKYYPAVGERVVYSPFDLAWFKPPTLPADVPWTHLGRAGDAQPEVPQ